jgi:hypothetical protein
MFVNKQINLLKLFENMIAECSLALMIFYLTGFEIYWYIII